MNIIDTSDALLAAFDADGFDMERWVRYIDGAKPGVKELCVADMEACLRAGCSWEGDYLPVLNGVVRKPEKRAEAVRTFHAVTGQLDDRIRARFGRTVDADVILYLGLCSGAGWVTSVGGKTTVLLGIEKIIELDWCSADAMTGLIVHELGHVYQAQYGVLHRETQSNAERFLWQLFTEGIAMVFEQETVGAPERYHQDRGGWKRWCDRNAELIRRSFYEDLPEMTFETQRYFGDWVRFEGQPDTGYYLGARFVRFLLEREDFDRILSYDLAEVKDAFERFLRAPL